MHRNIFVFTAAAFVLALAGCSNDPTVSNTANGGVTNSNVTFVQVDRIGRPGVKELYLPYAKHDAFNGSAPTADVSQVAPQIDTFVTGTASNSGGRSPAISQYAQALLAPDALIADLSNPATRASYLGFETSGQIATDCTGAAPTTFGGRGLTDDVVNAMLGITFGSLATGTTLKAPTPNVGAPIAADDGAEKDGRPGRPNLTNQFVGCPNKGLTLQQFPYLGSPL
ncbi:MAG: hypothetical protein PVSMB8_11670 [Vulcanimicrobiaceae bacterium]